MDKYYRKRITMIRGYKTPEIVQRSTSKSTKLKTPKPLWHTIILVLKNSHLSTISKQQNFVDACKKQTYRNG